MKKANEIVAHLSEAPQYTKLQKQSTWNRFKNLLPFSLRQSILFMYERGGVLFFALNHPGYLKEFNYKLSLIKSLLKEAAALLPDLRSINDVKAFVSHQALGTEEKDSLSDYHYTENSQATFSNLATTPEIHDKIEEIREIIHCNQKPS